MRDQFYLVLRELDILTQLDHPNIIKVFEEYEDDQYYHFVMEYSSGGELLERILKKGTSTLSPKATSGRPRPR